MKILHLSNVIGEKKGGGVHEVVSNAYRCQKLLNHEPHIWHPGSNEDADSIRMDANIKALPTYGNPKYGIIKDLFKPISKNFHIKSFDIIHQHGIWMPMSLYSQKIRRKTKIKSVVQVHGYLGSYKLNIKKHIAFNFYEKSNLLNADALVACSMNEAQDLKNIFPQKEIAIVPNGVSSDFFNAISLKTHKLKKKKRMLFISQITPIKGLERLFKVLAKMGDKKFIDWEIQIAGYGDENYTKVLKELVIKLNLSDLISFIGSKFGIDKLDVLDNSEILVLPSYNENYGIVVAEALARGIPVLTTKGTPWQELNTHSCGFWVDNDNDGLATGLYKILETTELELFEMGKRGRELVKRKYIWNKTILNTIEIYKWVINGGVKPDFFI